MYELFVVVIFEHSENVVAVVDGVDGVDVKSVVSFVDLYERRFGLIVDVAYAAALAYVVKGFVAHAVIALVVELNLSQRIVQTVVVVAVVVLERPIPVAL